MPQKWEGKDEPLKGQRDNLTIGWFPNASFNNEGCNGKLNMGHNLAQIWGFGGDPPCWFWAPQLGHLDAVFIVRPVVALVFCRKIWTSSSLLLGDSHPAATP